MDRAKRRVLGAGAALLAIAAGVRGAEGQSPRVVRVTARRFTFTPSEIELKRGEPVVFELTSEDVLMGFNIPDAKLRTDIIPGRTMRLAFTPTQAGTLPFLCDIFCGEGHESMNGTIVVT